MFDKNFRNVFQILLFYAIIQVGEVMEVILCSTFISGFESIIESLLKSKLQCKIQKIYDGLIIYKTDKIEQAKVLPFFNNTYFVIGQSQTNNSVDINLSIRDLLKQTTLNYKVLNYVKPKNKKDFKIIALDKNQPTAINYKLIRNLEYNIGNALNLKVGQRKHDLDIVFVRRSENIILLLMKLTYNRITEKSLSKGELRPELAYFMSYLADTELNDLIIDPFCGHGAIPKEIVRHFDYNIVFASDINEELITNLKKEYKNNNKNFYIKVREALHLDYIKDKGVNKIITDPPWNIYDKTETNFVEFYSNFLQECERILADNGTAIILMGNIENFEKALSNSKFKIINKFHILVNGKKANIYKLKKKF